MFKCIVCGTELPDGAVECLHCKVCQQKPKEEQHMLKIKLATVCGNATFSQDADQAAAEMKWLERHLDEWLTAASMHISSGEELPWMVAVLTGERFDSDEPKAICIRADEPGVRYTIKWGDTVLCTKE